MASLIPGFEYDIFISYRQKDNKGERWVSEFVEALKTELESTFKEEISLYFDINLHDGLLETHDVNASLKEKLKCLVFIPIISRTYCDPKAFAWEYEFKAFINQAENDRFGLKVKLPNGNIATRVLPVKIHELDPNDVKLCESILGGILRGVDFIYKSPGVNRPLMANEEHPKDNLNKTYYRDQINKVANALNDIIQSLNRADQLPGKRFENVRESGTPFSVIRNSRLKGLLSGRNLRRKLSFFALLIISVIAGFMLYRTFYQNNFERSLAILPMRISDNDPSLKNDADYFTEALNDKVNMIRGISLKPYISTLQFKNSEKPLDEIRKELRTNFTIDGSMRSEGGNTTLWIELSSARKKKMLWSKTYIWNLNQAHLITMEIVQAIVSNLSVELTSLEESQLRAEPSKSENANMSFISANAILNDAWSYFNYGDKMLDSASFTSAIAKFSKVIREDSSFAAAYARRAIAITWGFNDHQVDSSYLSRCRMDIARAISLNPNLAEAQTALGFYYYYCNIDYNKALFYFNRAAELSPGNYQPLYYLSLVYRRMGKWDDALDLSRRAVRLNPQEPLFLTNLGMTYAYMHKFDSALIIHQKAIDLMPGWSASYKNKLTTLVLRYGKAEEVKSLMYDAVRKTGDNMIDYVINYDIYEHNYNEAFRKSEMARPADFGTGGSKYLYMAEISNLMDKPEKARIYYDSALVMLNVEINNDPMNCYYHGLLGIAWAGLGNRKKAVEEGERAIILAENNKMDEVDMKVYLAQIYTMLREYDNAVSLIAYLFNNPSMFSEEQLRSDPIWNPLMDNREYRKIISKYARDSKL